MIAFEKYHGLANDYLVVDDRAGHGLEPHAVRRICDRTRGVGADGILLRGPDPEPGCFALRILNPDGSEAEKSGNGLRIFARYLYDQLSNRPDASGISPEGALRVRTLGGDVRCWVLEGGRAVRVEMGQASFVSETIPVAGPAREVLREPIEIEGVSLEFSAATVGNPHCVVLRETVSAEEARALGPALENEPRFPNRTNVQFVQVLDRGRLRIEIWERGAGYTLASGSSSCAAAAVAHRLGLCDDEVTVLMPGGELRVEIGADYEITQQGPVVHVASGRIHPEALC